MSQAVPLFARQAIYDRDMDVVSYELLFRHSDQNYASFVDGDQASSTVLLNAFGDHSLEDLTQNKPAFVNFTPTLINNPPMIPSANLVVEILEDVKVDAQLIQSIEKLKSDGYTIALDDFFISKDTKKLLGFADIIKIDVLSLSNSQIQKYVDRLKPLKYKLLAEKIENHEMMQFCLDLGFDLFQGYFLCKPQIVTGRRVDENKQATIKLLAALNDRDVDFDTVVDTLASDPALSYKILRLVNSSAMAMPVEIKSLNQAVSMLGLKAIKNWASFLLLANAGNKPRELGVISMCRAKFCENLGAMAGDKNLSDSCFTVGLLSNLDAFLDMPMEELLDKLNLAEEIRSALRNQQGLVGEIFDLAQKYERGDWGNIKWDALSKYDINAQAANTHYANAVFWATEISYS
jgi:EAL and modified HD-GYP domain-containing signal transduction protein